MGHLAPLVENSSCLKLVTYNNMPRTLLLLRVSLAALFLWFGTQQWLYPDAWVSFLPAWLGYLPVPANSFIMINGCAEIIGALALLLGVWVQPVSILLGLHLLGIAATMGGAIGARDAALGLAAIALGLSPSDAYTIDAKFKT